MVNFDLYISNLKIRIFFRFLFPFGCCFLIYIKYYEISENISFITSFESRYYRKNNIKIILSHYVTFLPVDFFWRKNLEQSSLKNS